MDTKVSPMCLGNTSLQAAPWEEALAVSSADVAKVLLRLSPPFRILRTKKSFSFPNLFYCSAPPRPPPYTALA